MSKQGYLSRYSLIVKKLRGKSYSTYEELSNYIEQKLEDLQMQDDTLDIAFSKRTLQRDLREIRNLYGIEIEYSKSSKGYYISNEEAKSENFQRMMEAFDMFNTLNAVPNLAPFVYLEQRRPQGTENLYDLLHAIKNTMKIQFSYQKFWEEEITQRTAEPYALKEFRNRWYVIAKDEKDSKIKSFSLDRLSNLNVTNSKFIYPETFDVERAYRYCFGVIAPDEKDEKPQEVVLSFTPFQGKYIKTLPLHGTQRILADNDKELRVQLTIYLTHDFIMELLSFGAELEVLQPLVLVEKIKTAHESARNRYAWET